MTQINWRKILFFGGNPLFVMVFYSLICYSSLDYDGPSTTETQVNTKTIGHVYSFCKENLNLMPKVKYFYLMFLYERFYEIWIMQFVLLSRLKPDLCKSSGKTFKRFSLFIQKTSVYIQGNILSVLSRIYFDETFLRFLSFIQAIFSTFFTLQRKVSTSGNLQALGRMIQGIFLICSLPVLNNLLCLKET